MISRRGFRLSVDRTAQQLLDVADGLGVGIEPSAASGALLTDTRTNFGQAVGDARRDRLPSRLLSAPPLRLSSRPLLGRRHLSLLDNQQHCPLLLVRGIVVLGEQQREIVPAVQVLQRRDDRFDSRSVSA
jgi:hypothetical protein